MKCIFYCLNSFALDVCFFKDINRLGNQQLDITNAPFVAGMMNNLIQSPLNPVNVVGNVGVHSWQVTSCAANTPADQSYQGVPTVVTGHQRTTRIAL